MYVELHPLTLLALKAPSRSFYRWTSTRGESVRERKPAQNPNKQTNDQVHFHTETTCLCRDPEGVLCRVHPGDGVAGDDVAVAGGRGAGAGVGDDHGQPVDHGAVPRLLGGAVAGETSGR
jgi:hypothetical protein